MEELVKQEKKSMNWKKIGMVSIRVIQIVVILNFLYVLTGFIPFEKTYMLPGSAESTENRIKSTTGYKPFYTTSVTIASTRNVKDYLTIRTEYLSGPIKKIQLDFDPYAPLTKKEIKEEGEQKAVEIKRFYTNAILAASGYAPNIDFSLLKTKHAKYHGESAGLMLTLQWIQESTRENLTKGRIIAGTGTMDSVGKVGEIGGISQKLKAAKNGSADIFFIPKTQEKQAKQEAKKLNYDVKIVGVSSLDEAMNYLKKKQ